jgi:hypothetical protein
MKAAAVSQSGIHGSKLSNTYDDRFYESQFADSHRSAHIYLSLLWQFIQPTAVLDVGCGRGAWLKACRDLGSTRLIGLDGDWNNQSLMIDSAIEFRSIDLNRPFSVSEQIDLAMSLEVAEHLEPVAAPGFVKCLAETSDVVLFSAAYPKQGGTNHINEQPQSYWARLFSAHDLFPVDLFRPTLWGNEDVCFWYRQIAFLYVKRGCNAADRLAAEGISEIVDISFMDCVHPELFRYVAEPSFRRALASIVPIFIDALRRRLSKVRNP